MYKYQLIAADLRAEIEGHPPGHRLPSERELCERYEVVRETVRKAVWQLQNEGLVESAVGRGTFVVERGTCPACGQALPG